jgi:hypothetical protein
VSTEGLTVRFVASEAEIPPDLWDACFPPPLEGRWWYQTLEQSGLEDQFTFAYAVIHVDERPIGIAPLFLMAVPLGLAVPERLRPILSIPARHLSFLADPLTLFVGSPCTDEGTVGLLPDWDRRRALICLQDALEAEARRRNAAMVVWKDFPDAWQDDLMWLARRRRLFRLVGFPGTVVEVPSASKAGYYASLTSKHRTTLKRKLNRGTERAALDATVVQDPDVRTLDEIATLFQQTYERAPIKFERLDRRFFAAIATKPVAHFVLLRERETSAIVAFMLCFEAGSRIINKYIGIDYARPRDWMLYFRLWDAALDWCFTRGATSVQSGQTGYSAKIEIGNSLVPLTCWARHRNRFLHSAFALFAHHVSWQTLDHDLAQFLAAHPKADATGGTRTAIHASDCSC